MSSSRSRFGRYTRLARELGGAAQMLALGALLWLALQAINAAAYWVFTSDIGAP